MEGWYKHFKGGIYFVLGTVFHSEDNGEHVLYMSLKNKKLWVRPSKMFFEEVEHEGVKVKRFQKING